MIDTIIAGARIYDGDGAPPIHTDVAIVDDRIALIGDLGERDAYARVSGASRALAPGFIDVHSHSDELWLIDGRCEGKIRQGVTTEIGGNCGRSAAPVPHVAHDTWHDLDAFFSAVARSGIALNVASLVGLGTTRAYVAGDLDGRLDARQSLEQADLVRQAIEQGAIGVSSGLVYVPSRYADLDELVTCARVGREAGAARYVSHIRGEGATLVPAVDEAIEVGRRADVATHLSHHKAFGKRNWGSVDRSLERIARARASGLAVWADAYPYTAACTNLDFILPGDALRGGASAVRTRLADPETVVALALRLELDWGEAWGDIAISRVGSERNAHVVGRRLSEIAREWRLSPPRAALRLLHEEDRDVEALFFALAEDDVATVLSAEFVSIGSDASARAIDGPTACGLPHPRTFGTFPRVFGRFVRGRKTLGVAEAIRRMTSLAADQFGLAGRGRIRVGAFADLVLFDEATIVDTATYDAPFSYPTGIDTVWVNGVAVVCGGRTTRARPGRVLRGGR